MAENFKDNAATAHLKTIWAINLAAIFIVHVGAWAFHSKLDFSTKAIAPQEYVETIDISEETTKEKKPFNIEEFLTLNNIKTFDHYIAWFNRNIDYQKDETDEWLTPEQILERRNGDCEDMAFLSEVVLKHFGYEPRVLAVNYPDGAHVFTIFKKDGRMHIIDNQRYIITNTESLVQIALFLYTKHKVTAFFEIHNDPKSITLLYNEVALKKMLALLAAKYGHMMRS